MERCFADLHIHSCLSPCANDDMTPCNICGMAALKGLRLIAVTDHNSGENLPYVKAAADDMGLVLVPGIEITTKEEVHLLAYFDQVERAVNFGRMLRAHLPKIKNRAPLFGRQIIMNEKDEELAEEDALLIGATDIPLDELCKRIRNEKGVPVPAHINRGANGLLVNLGFIPQALSFQAVEVWRGLPCPHTPQQGKHILHSSDAHRLGDILEPTEELILHTLSPADFLEFLSTYP